MSEEEKGEQVTIGKEELEAMKESIKTLSEKGDEDVNSISSLLKEVMNEKEEPAEKTPEMPASMQDVSPKEFLGFVTQQVNKVIQAATVPLQQEVTTLRILRDVDKTEAKYENFWELKKEIKAETKANPYVKMEDAFILACKKKGVDPILRNAAPKKEEKEGDDKKEVKPKVEKKPFAGGEKPGIAGAEKTPPVNILDAAAKAAEELGVET